MPPLTSPEGALREAEMVARARAQIQAEEDRRIFEALDAVGRDPDYVPMRPLPPGEVYVAGPGEYVGSLPPRPDLPFMAHEQIGMAVINPRGLERLEVRRVQMPEFEIASNPTIRLDDIRQRRFDLIDRTPPPPVQEMTPAEMEKVAIIIRRTFWERLLASTDEYPPIPPLSLPEQVRRDIDEQVLGEWLTTPKYSTAWDKLDLDF